MKMSLKIFSCLLVEHNAKYSLPKYAHMFSVNVLLYSKEWECEKLNIELV